MATPSSFTPSVSIPEPKKKNSQSLYWNLSGSALFHIIAILGFGFYITLPEPPPLLPSQQTISINLKSTVALSESTTLGAGSETLKKLARPNSDVEQTLLHTRDSSVPFNTSTFKQDQQRLINELNEENQLIKTAERIGYLGVYDQDPASKQYQQHWSQYVEDFGTKNYPPNLFQKDLEGELELDVLIDRMGNAIDISVHKTSGNREIDRAAILVAKLASPYPPLPADMANKYDVLHIIRIWRFNNKTVSSQPSTQ